MAEKANPFARFVKHFTEGTVVFREGDEGDEMYILQSGKVAIKRRVPHGEITLAVLEKGDFFGEMAILERLPRSASAEVVEAGDFIVISGELLGDMIKATPEIAVRMLRKYSLRLRETSKQFDQLSAATGGQKPVLEAVDNPAPTAGTIQAEAIAYFVAQATGNVFPVFRPEALLGRFDSVTGMSPDVDLTNEDQTRNISRRHARLVMRDSRFFIAEEIGTMNGTYLNGQRLTTGVLTPIGDGDELTLCRLPLVFKVPQTH